MSMRSPLARVRGLGTAKEGVAHWWSQRLTAIALVPLTLWFIASLASLAGADHEAIKLWAGGPVVASMLLLLIIATFYHAYLGLQVVIEDYVHGEAAKLALLLLVKGSALLLAAIAIMSVLTLALGS